MNKKTPICFELLPNSSLAKENPEITVLLLPSNTPENSLDITLTALSQLKYLMTNFFILNFV